MRTIRKLFITVFTVLSFAMLTPLSTVDAQPAPLVQQGDRFWYEYEPGKLNHCTIGYVDAARRTIMFTGHCTTLPNAKVFASNPDGSPGVEMGNVTLNHYRGTPHSDMAIANINHNVNIGGNIYSGDKWVMPHQVMPGDRVCSRGANSNAVHCGFSLGWEAPNLVQATRNAGGIPGDSGGPAWVPGKGFIGMYSGYTNARTFWTYPDMSYGKIDISILKKNAENAINSAIHDFRLPITPVKL